MKMDIETRLLGYTLLIIVAISGLVVIFLMSTGDTSIYTFIGIISAVILLGALMAKPVAASFTHPIKTMLEGTRAISQGYFDTSIPVQRRDELGDLASAINQLGQNLTQYDHQRAQAEQELRHSEQRFKNFAEATSDWFWETDAELRYSWLSDNVEAVTGMSREWHYGKTQADISVLDLNADAWNEHLLLLKARKPFRDFEFCRRGPKGELNWVRANGTPVYSKDGPVSRLSRNRNRYYRSEKCSGKCSAGSRSFYACN